jgi:predicted nucleic acid-binding protein
MYLDTSALWIFYARELGWELVEQALTSGSYKCVTSAWTELELNRSLTRRVHKKEMTLEEGETLRLFFERDLKARYADGTLKRAPITDFIISTGKYYILNHNLYSADAAHATTAIHHDCDFLVSDDYHFFRERENFLAKFGLFVIKVSTDSLPKD